jgi:NitT/TauT family transport system substrate-binding protein
MRSILAKRRRRRLVATLAAVTLLVAACGDGDEPDEPDEQAEATEEPTDEPTETETDTEAEAEEEAEEPEEVEITHSIDLPGVISYELNLPTLVADANGFLAAEGIEIANYVTGSGGTLRQAVIAGEYGVGLFATVHPVLARSGGSPWKAVFSAHDKEIFSLIVRADIADEVQSVEDLAGRRVGFSTPGAGSWFIGGALLQGAGLNPDTDLEYVSIGGDPAVIYTALQEGQVDAFSSWEPTTTRAIADGIAVPLVPIYEDAVHEEFIGPSALSMVLIATEDQIAEDPEFVQSLVDAHMRAMEWIADADSEEIAELVIGHPNTAQMFDGLDADLVVQMIDNIRGGFGTGCLDPDGYQTELDILLEYEVVEAEVPFEEFADTTFAGQC